MTKDWIDLKIDTARMTGGQDVEKMIRKGRGGGIPWLIILDADKNELTNSDGPKGNVGCPVQPHEVAHFMEMLRTSRNKVTDAELKTLESELEIFAKPYRR